MEIIVTVLMAILLAAQIALSVKQIKKEPLTAKYFSELT